MASEMGGVSQSLGGLSVSSLEKHHVPIHKFSALDERVQSVALEAIAAINRETSTAPGTTWESYTALIRDRLENCANAKNTLFIARVGDQVVGYCAFYTLQDKVPYPSRFLTSEGEAYCSWTAVHKDFKGQGIAQDLKLEIFNPEGGFTTFRGHIKKTNDASLRVLEKFAESGYIVSSRKEGSQVVYSVTKPS